MRFIYINEYFNLFSHLRSTRFRGIYKIGYSNTPLKCNGSARYYWSVLSDACPEIVALCNKELSYSTSIKHVVPIEARAWTVFIFSLESFNLVILSLCTKFNFRIKCHSSFNWFYSISNVWWQLWFVCSSLRRIHRTFILFIKRIKWLMNIWKPLCIGFRSDSLERGNELKILGVQHIVRLIMAFVMKKIR